MSEPAFSIVIPTYNRAGFIADTIRSILSQTFGDFEIIVVDDGSTDNTDAVVTSISDPRIKYVKKVNGERGAARNAGARLARGRFVNFVDSDDVLYPNHTQVANNFIRENPGIRVFHLGYDVKDAHGKFLRDSSDVDNINRQILSGNVLSCNGVFIERNVALENPFSENRVLSAIEDWELWIRLAAKHEFVHVPEITSTVINHDERSVMSVDTGKIKSKTNLFMEMISGNPDLQSAFGKKIDKTMASTLTYTALHLAIAKAGRSEVASYLVRGLKTNPGEVFRKRFLVILKLLVFR